MKLRVLAFATAADAIGSGEISVDLPEGSRVADLKEHLEREHPKLERHWPRLAVAIDGELARPETEIPDGAEVALLPPVSGGSPEPSRVRLTREPLDVAAVTASVSRREHGAVLVFLGTVRDSHRGRPVTRLTYTAYEPMAVVRMQKIVDDLESASEGLTAALVHRLGEVESGEPSVVIAVSSPHRPAAYEASRTALERLKAEVPIWKQEHYADGEAVWREEEALVG